LPRILTKSREEEEEKKRCGRVAFVNGNGFKRDLDWLGVPDADALSV